MMRWVFLLIALFLFGLGIRAAINKKQLMESALTWTFSLLSFLASIFPPDSGSVWVDFFHNSQENSNLAQSESLKRSEPPYHYGDPILVETPSISISSPVPEIQSPSVPPSLSPTPSALFSPEPIPSILSTPEPPVVNPSPEVPIILLPPSYHWEGDYVIGTLSSVAHSDHIECTMNGTRYLFADSVSSLSLDNLSLETMLELLQSGTECRFDLDTTGYVISVEIAYDFEGILTRIDYDMDENISGIQIDYYDGSGGMASVLLPEIAEEVESYLCVGEAYIVHYDIMGDITSITPV